MDFVCMWLRRCVMQNEWKKWANDMRSIKSNISKQPKLTKVKANSQFNIPRIENLNGRSWKYSVHGRIIQETQEATRTFKTDNKHYEWMKWEKRSYIFDWKYHSIGKRIKMNRNLTQNTDKNYKKFQQQKKCGKNMMNVMHFKSVFFSFLNFAVDWFAINEISVWMIVCLLLNMA